MLFIVPVFEYNGAAAEGRGPSTGRMMERAGRAEGGFVMRMNVVGLSACVCVLSGVSSTGVSSTGVGEPAHFCGVGCDQSAPAPLPMHRALDRLAVVDSTSHHAPRGGAGLEDGSVVDLLVVYSPQAADQNGGAAGIEALIFDGLDELNAAAADSQVATTFRVVHTQEVAHTQSGSMSLQLSRLRDPSDGVLDEVHDLRDAHKADLVMLVISAGDVCGIANVGVGPGNTPTPQNAFSVVSALCLTAPVSAFAHEVGHNMGLLHGYEENPCTNGGSRFAKGYQAPDESFNTVMGVGVGPRVLRFANPAVDLAGQPTGVAVGSPEAADAATALTMAAPVVARYRDRDLNANGIEDTAEIDAGDLNDCDGNGYPDFVEQDFNRNGVPDACDLASATSTDADGDGVPEEAEPARLYVDADATGSGTGLSWPDAMVDLQDALGLARLSGDIEEIWIAEGLYLPGGDGHRASRFDLVSGVAISGGFAGMETSLDQRIDGAHPTVLSGDLNQDDLPDPSSVAGRASRQDNALNVLFMYEESEPIVLDGLVIEHGFADFEINCGGFMNNAGGMVAFGGDLTITNCEFRDNAAVNTGALILINDVRSRITNSWFHHNEAVDGLFYGASYPTDGALPYEGYIGAIRVTTFYSGTDNQFIGNLVEFNRDNEGVSGMQFSGSEPVFANNVLARNTSSSSVAGHALSVLDAEGFEVINSTIAHNTAPNGFGARAVGIGTNRSQIVVSNSILYGNVSGSVTDERAQFSQVQNGTVQFHNSIVQGWTGTYPGVNTDGADPLFADAPGGDFSILAGSPAIDRGDNTRVPIDSLDLDGDGDQAEALPLDFSGGERFVDDADTPDTGVGFAGGGGPVVDAGAIEYQAPATCPADLAEPFGVLDLADISLFVSSFLGQQPAGDIDGNGIYDLGDISGFVGAFQSGCP